MQEHLAAGLSAAQAAAAVLSDDQQPAPAGPTAPPNAATRPGLADQLRASLDGYDEPGAQAVLDRLLAEYTVESVLRDVLMPYLRELGERCQRGEVSVAQEHFASNVLRGRLAGIAKGWGNVRGRHAFLACPPGEHHDLPLLAFGIALSRLGWRVTYLGVDTPAGDLAASVEQARPEVVVLAATVPQRFTDAAVELARMARFSPLLVAGAGASPEIADRLGASLLPGDPVTAAERVAQGVQGA
jgi:methanogenic corrinoid protein MtbC1